MREALTLPDFLLVPQKGPRAAVLLGLVLRWSRGRTSYTREELARCLGRSVATVGRWIGELVDLGLLERDAGGGLRCTEEAGWAWIHWTTAGGVLRVHRAAVGLPRAAQRVHARLYLHQARGARFLPSTRSLARDLELPRRTVQRSLRVLEGAGLLVGLGWTRRRSGSRLLTLWGRLVTRWRVPESIARRFQPSPGVKGPAQSVAPPQILSSTLAGSEAERPPAQANPPRSSPPRRGPASLGDLLPGLLGAVLA